MKVLVGSSLTFRVLTDWNVGKWLRVLEQYLQALEQLSHDQNLISVAPIALSRWGRSKAVRQHRVGKPSR